MRSDDQYTTYELISHVVWLPPWAVLSGDPGACTQAQTFLKCLVDSVHLLHPDLSAIVREMVAVRFFFPGVECEIESCISYVDHAQFLKKKHRDLLETLPQILTNDLKRTRDVARELNVTLRSNAL